MEKKIEAGWYSLSISLKMLLDEGIPLDEIKEKLEQKIYPRIVWQAHAIALVEIHYIEEMDVQVKIKQLQIATIF